jgi:hypothetical protein
MLCSWQNCCQKVSRDGEKCCIGQGMVVCYSTGISCLVVQTELKQDNTRRLMLHERRGLSRMLQQLSTLFHQDGDLPVMRYALCPISVAKATVQFATGTLLELAMHIWLGACTPWLSKEVSERPLATYGDDDYVSPDNKGHPNGILCLLKPVVCGGMHYIYFDRYFKEPRQHAC